MTPRYLLLLLSLLAPVVHAAPSAATATTAAAPAALQALRAAAGQGDPEAMAALGWRYLRGEGVKEDDHQAMKWFRAAMDKGSASGLYGWSRGLRYGYGLTQDIEAGDKLALAAAEQGDAQAQMTAAHHAEEAGDDKGARAWLARASDQGHVPGMRRYGYMLLNGDGGPRDTERGLTLLRQAAQMNDGRAMVLIGEAYEFGKGLEADPVQARAWYRRGADAGDERGHFNLGDVLQRGVGGPRDLAEALRQYRLAADQGDQDSAYALAKAHGASGDAGIDLVEMRRWIVRGLELNDPKAMLWQASILAGGIQVPPDQATAIRLYTSAVELGNVTTSYYLASCYEEGKGVPKDLARAAQLYRSASASVPAALQRLVLMQLTGRGMPADPDAAMALVDAELARGELAPMLRLAAFLQRHMLNDVADAVRARVLRHPEAAAARADDDYLAANGELGAAYRDAARFDLAQPILEERLALLEKKPDGWQPAIVSALGDLGYLYYVREQPQRADDLLARSLALLRASPTHDMTLVYRLMDVATFYTGGDQFAKAEAVRREALALAEQLRAAAPAKVEPDTLAWIRTDLAFSLHTQGRYQEAAAQLVQAVDEIETYHYPHSMALGTALDLQGDTWRALGRPDLAEVNFRRLLALRERLTGNPSDRQRATVLGNLAVLATQARQYAEAEGLLRKALALYEPVAHKRDLGLANLYHQQGKLLRETRRYVEADAAFERALAIKLSIPAAAHWDAAAVMHDLGLSLRAQDQPEKAAAMLARAFEIRAARQSQHHLTRQSGDALAAVYRASGKTAAAQAVEERMRGPSAGL